MSFKLSHSDFRDFFLSVVWCAYFTRNTDICWRSWYIDFKLFIPITSVFVVQERGGCTVSFAASIWWDSGRVDNASAAVIFSQWAEIISWCEISWCERPCPAIELTFISIHQYRYNGSSITDSTGIGSYCGYDSRSTYVNLCCRLGFFLLGVKYCSERSVDILCTWWQRLALYRCAHDPKHVIQYSLW